MREGSEKELFILLTWLQWNPNGNAIFVTFGISTYNKARKWSLSRVMKCAFLNDSLFSPSLVSVVSLGKSNHRFLWWGSLWIISSVVFSSMKENTSIPSWMETSSGKSIRYAWDNTTTLKENTLTLPKRAISDEEWLQLGQTYSLVSFFKTTSQLQWSSKEVVTRLLQIPNLNHFQGGNTLDFTIGIVREGETTDSQFLHSLTALQPEDSIFAHKATRSNPHRLQGVHSNKLEYFKTRETLMPNIQHSKPRKLINYQLSDGIVRAGTTGNHNALYCSVQGIELFNGVNIWIGGIGHFILLDRYSHIYSLLKSERSTWNGHIRRIEEHSRKNWVLEWGNIWSWFQWASLTFKSNAMRPLRHTIILLVNAKSS